MATVFSLASSVYRHDSIFTAYGAMISFCPNVYKNGCPCHWGFHGLNRVAYPLFALLLVSGTSKQPIPYSPPRRC